MQERHSNLICGEITKESHHAAIDKLIQEAKESAGKRIEHPVRDNAFGAVFQAIEEYKNAEKAETPWVPRDWGEC